MIICRRHQLLFACFSSDFAWFFFYLKVYTSIERSHLQKMHHHNTVICKGEGVGCIRLLWWWNSLFWWMKCDCVVLLVYFYINCIFSLIHILFAWFLETTIFCIEIFYRANLSPYYLTSWQLGDSSLWW